MTENETNRPTALTGLEIAIIGMACRFPGAKNIREFRDNLENGVESITFFSNEELEKAGIPAETLSDPKFIKAKGILKDIEYFDASFFGYTPREAELMDPQVRIFHECAWEALEDAGYDTEFYDGLIGLFAGAAHNHYWEGLGKFSGKSAEIGQWSAYQLVDKDYMTLRVSYALNLNGPSFSIYTACSTSLVAIHQACQAILSGECDMALAGGITLILPQRTGYFHREGMVMSPDGHCRAFDARGKGTIFGDGAGIVVLKRLEDAAADRDHIYAMIKGSAVNNDGTRKTGFTAPSVEGQVEALRAAFQTAHVEPESIGYLETHGTGTSLGDPIEMEALTMAFNTRQQNFCGLGAVKTNIGHLDAAAGVAGFIKTVLAITHRLLPPSLHFERPNPEIDFENSPFYVNTGAKAWENRKYPLRAGVSSFGIGGTNAHMILEEAPGGTGTGGPAPLPDGQPAREYQLILLSAKTESALDQITQNLAEHFKNNPGINLADAAYTLRAGRRALPYRRMSVCGSVEETVETMASLKSERLQTARVPAEDELKLIFMFPGQGAQYAGMGRELYQTEPVFREEMDRCFEILNGQWDYNIKEILYPSLFTPHPSPVTLHPSPDINQTEIAQPVLFIFEYALARFLMKLGIKPYAMIGHSIGEYVAACLSGVFSLEEALAVVVSRGKLMQGMPPGAMLGILGPEEELKSLLKGNDNVSLAAVNGPRAGVVSGTREAIDEVENQAGEMGYETRRLHTSHAFHSALMDPMLKRFREVVGGVSLNQPKIPYISNVTGHWAAAEEAVDPGYWATHLRKTVRFARGITTLMEINRSIFLEVGPGKTLSTFVRQSRQKDNKIGSPVINLVKHPREDVPDPYLLLDRIGRLWIYGTRIDWKEFYRAEKRGRISLPTYPFERQRYWIDEKSLTSLPGTVPGKSLPKKKTDIADWFYIPSWKRSLLPPPSAAKAPDSAQAGAISHWLLFMDTCGLGERLARDFEKESRVTRVKPGAGFAYTPAAAGEQGGQYTINPAAPGDYDALFSELRSRDQLPRRIVHLWNVTAPGPEPPTAGAGETAFFSLLYLAQALGKQDVEHDIHCAVVTSSMQEVTGEEMLCPQKATVLGPVMVIPREYPYIRCCAVDIVTPEPGSEKEEKLVEQLAAELTSHFPDKIIAFRSNYRLVQTFEPVHPGPAADEIPRLRQKGVYLITGGLGGIGLVLAGYLARTLQAKLILVGRSAFPGREEWDHWLSTHPEQDRISHKILKLKELEETGAEVLVLSADTAKDQEMQPVINRAEARFGPIHGVIHAAGVPGGGVIQLKKTDSAKHVLAPKVNGTLVLDRLFNNKPLDFFFLCSSVNSILPMVGQVDYYAANAFMDAFAYYKTSRHGIFTVSVNWDTWQEVGMAVHAFRKEVNHPLLDRYVMAEPNREQFITHFNLDKHWVLNEHMTVEKIGILPGVSFLEMVRGAFESRPNSAGGILEISDVYFLNPLMVEAQEEKEVYLILEKQNTEEEYNFRVRSRTHPGADTWQDHAVGKVARRENSREHKMPLTHQLREIRSRCTEIVENMAVKLTESTDSSTIDRLVIFGPRWSNLREVRYGKNQGLAYLELPEPYLGDLESYKLHPALLDSAAAFLNRYAGDTQAYIPFSYKKLKIKAPLPAKIFSYSRLLEDPTSDPGSEFLKFDIAIMDEKGGELVDIEEFTMMKVSSQVKKKIKEKEQPYTAPAPAAPPAESTDPLSSGILPPEGIDVFARVLAGKLPQVAVSTTDLTTRMETGNPASAALLNQVLKNRQVSGPRHPRPELSSPYAAPGTEIEQKIEAVWQEVLGIEQLGINDDFFELGGDSVSIIQLNSKLKKTLERDIPDVILFRYPTIGSLAGYLDRENHDEEGTHRLIDRSEELEKRKSRLQKRFNRR